jgi:hypothetical protein
MKILTSLLGKVLTDSMGKVLHEIEPLTPFTGWYVKQPTLPVLPNTAGAYNWPDFSATGRFFSNMYAAGPNGVRVYDDTVNIATFFNGYSGLNFGGTDEVRMVGLMQLGSGLLPYGFTWNGSAFVLNGGFDIMPVNTCVSSGHSRNGVGAAVASAQYDELNAYRWNITNNRFEKVTVTGRSSSGGTGSSERIEFSGDGNVMGYTWGNLLSQLKIHRWDGSSYVAVSQAFAGGNTPSIAFSGNGSVLATAEYYSANLRTYRWNGSSYVETAVPAHQPSQINSLKLSLDGQLLVVYAAGTGLHAYQWNEVNNRFEQLAGHFDVQTTGNHLKLGMADDCSKIAVGTATYNLEHRP